MHSFARHLHQKSDKDSAKPTRGLIVNLGWRYDLFEWFADTFMFGGKLRELRDRTLALAPIQLGASILDVGCGTGTLALAVQKQVGASGRVIGIDPGAQQIVRARTKAKR